jgi:hypothetical protein
MINLKLCLVYIPFLVLVEASPSRPEPIHVYSFSATFLRYLKPRRGPKFADELFFSPESAITVFKSLQTRLKEESLQEFVSILSFAQRSVASNISGPNPRGTFVAYAYGHLVDVWLSILLEAATSSDFVDLELLFMQTLEAYALILENGVSEIASHLLSMALSDIGDEILYRLFRMAIRAQLLSRHPIKKLYEELAIEILNCRKADIGIVVGILHENFELDPVELQITLGSDTPPENGTIAKQIAAIRQRIRLSRLLSEFDEAMRRAFENSSGNLLGADVRSCEFREKLFSLSDEDLKSYERILAAIVSNEAHSSVLSFLAVNLYISHPHTSTVSVSDRISHVVSPAHGTIRTIEVLWSEFTYIVHFEDISLDEQLLILSAKETILNLAVCMELVKHDSKNVEALEGHVSAILERSHTITGLGASAFLETTLIPAKEAIRVFLKELY